MYFLYKIRYYNFYEDKHTTDCGIMYADSLASAANALEDAYKSERGDSTIEMINLIPAGEEDSIFFELDEETYNKLKKEWIGEDKNE